MIIFENVTKIIGSGDAKRPVLTAARVKLPSDRRIAVLGPGVGEKKSFMDLLAGLILPDSGRIVRNTQVSFPPGYLGGFSRNLPVRVNVAHVARLYGADVNAVVNFVAQVSRLGEAFNQPFSKLVGAHRKNLSDILAFCIPFDVYLLSDDFVKPTGKRFNRDARALFEARAKASGMIITTQDPAFAREFCELGLLLKDGKLRLFDNIDRAIQVLEKDSAGPIKERAQRKRKKRTQRLPRE